MTVALIDRQKLLIWADGKLEAVYASPRHGNLKDPTSELIYLLLTVKTRILDVRPYYLKLRKLSGGWKDLPNVDPDILQKIIEPLGLSEKRTDQLISISGRLKQDFGRVSLSPLRKMSTIDAIAYLKSLPGVGTKIARCVALYSLGADISPMDVNATRVLSRLGVLPRDIVPENAHAWMDRLTPERSAYRIHVNLISHGGRVCVSKNPHCELCPLIHKCRFYFTGY